MRRMTMALMVLLASAPLWANELRLPPGKWWENPHLVERVGLTSEQQAQIKTLVIEHARQMIDLTADVKRAEFDLKQLADDPDFDPDHVRTAYAHYQQARMALDSDRFELLLSIRQVLSSEQWQELSKMREEHRDRRPDGFPGQRPRGPIRPRGNRGPRSMGSDGPADTANTD